MTDGANDLNLWCLFHQLSCSLRFFWLQTGVFRQTSNQTASQVKVWCDYGLQICWSHEIAFIKESLRFKKQSCPNRCNKSEIGEWRRCQSNTVCTCRESPGKMSNLLRWLNVPLWACWAFWTLLASKLPLMDKWFITSEKAPESRLTCINTVSCNLGVSPACISSTFCPPCLLDSLCGSAVDVSQRESAAERLGGKNVTSLWLCSPEENTPRVVV